MIGKGFRIFVLTVLVVLLLPGIFPSSASLQAYTGWITPYFDGPVRTNIFSISIPAFEPFDMWIAVAVWDGGGLKDVEFSIEYPEIVVSTDTACPPNAEWEFWDTHYEITLNECQAIYYSWIWVFKQTLYVTEGQGCYISLGGTPTSDLPVYHGCDNQPYTLLVCNSLNINVPVSTHLSSWGAIKNLYR